MLNPVRMDRTFQAFADRVVGVEFRTYLEQMEKALEGRNPQEQEIAPQLIIPDGEAISTELLRNQK